MNNNTQSNNTHKNRNDNNYNLDNHHTQLLRSRSTIYGDPRENHRAIAMAWATLLHPHAKKIANLEPIPEHTVALMMAMFKLCRSRRVFHADNYDDARVYLGFAEQWQGEGERHTDNE
ncbi:MAG: DUF6378 domain-containing protein [Phycisphaerales bacterium JB052]